MQTSLTDSFLLNAELQNTKHLLSLAPLRFLAHFYTTAGLPRPHGAVPYEELNGEPTWERSESHNFRGHMFGHYLSALAMAYSVCGDKDTKAALLENITTCVTELAKCQAAFAQKHPARAGYIGPFGDGRLDELDGLAGGVGMPTVGQVWVPWYNLHKMLAGLTAIRKQVGGDIGHLALDIAAKFGEYFYTVRASQYTAENRQKLLHIEYGGMNDAFYELYRLTGDDRFKFCAECFDEVALFDALAQGWDVLPGKHANTQIPKFIGALKRYTTLQKPQFYARLTEAEKADLPKYLQAAQNFFDIVLAGHTYITGGNSAREHFHAPCTLSETIDRDDTHETCNGHNMLKLARELFKVTGDKQYADYYENALINVVLSSQNPETGGVMYFQPMGTGYNKLFGKNRFWCCNGTGIESFAKLQDSIYFARGRDIFVNMYFSSVFICKKRGVKLTQTANMPNSDTVTFTVDAVEPGAVLYFRVPSWCAGQPRAAVNGETISPVIIGGYVVICPAADDTICLTFPMAVSVEALADNPNIVAFRYGPAVLSAALGDWHMDAAAPNGIMVLVAIRDPNAPTILEIVGGVSVATWKAHIAQNLVRIQDSADGLVQFKLHGTDMDDRLVYTPHYRQYRQRYALYITLAESNAPVIVAKKLEEETTRRLKETATAYLTGFDNHAYEGEYNMQCHGSSHGMYGGKSFRHAQGEDGWFSYELPVTAGADNFLNVTLAKADKGRVWDMTINGEYFATETVASPEGAGEFYTSSHQIPNKFLTQGEPVIVKFEHSPDSPDGFVGGVFGVSVTPYKLV